MARQQDQAPRAHRLLALGALGLLAGAAALAFGRVFRGTGPTWKLLATAVASAAVAVLFERRSLFLATLASAALLLAAIGVMVFPHTTLEGLPTRETLRAVAEAMSRVGEQARVQVAPTPPLAPLLLAAITAVWTATFSAHSLAARAGSPVLAALPPVALLGFADTVMEDGPRPGYALLFLIGVLAVVFVDGIRRVRQWGPVFPWPGRGGRSSAAVIRGARRVALLAVAVAALLPGILPGFGAEPLLDLGSTAGDLVGFDPLVSIRAQLTRDTPVALFEVTASQPSYWRMLALDQFDGSVWKAEDLLVGGGPTLETPATLPTTWPVGSETLVQHFRVLNDPSFPWIPMAYPPESVDLQGAPIRYDQDLVSVVAADGLSEGDEYGVTSRPVAPDAEQLDREVFGPPEQYGRYTYLPADMPQDVRDIARQWAGPAARPAFERILAIQGHFRNGSFVYDLSARNLAGWEGLLNFVTQTRRGFCQQFAYSMAVMVRALGYPARVTVGFTQGAYDERARTYLVTTENSHSWVEVLFPDYGWLAFEPTPGRNNPVAAAYLAPRALEGCTRPGGCVGEETTTAGGRLSGGRGARWLFEERFPPSRRAARGPVRPGPEPEPEPEHPGVPYGLVIRILLVVAGAALLFVPATKAAARRLRLRRRRDPRRLVLTTYRVFSGQAADLGMARGEGETLREYCRRVESGVRFSDGHLDLLTGVAARAAYSPLPPTDEEAMEAVRAARTAIRDMRRDTKLVRRLAGIYRPGW